jgi:hypothetical protein
MGPRRIVSLLIGIALLASSLSVQASTSNVDAGRRAAAVSAPARVVLAQTSALARKAPPAAAIRDVAGRGPSNLPPGVSLFDRRAVSSGAPTAVTGPGAGARAAGIASGSITDAAGFERPRQTVSSILATAKNMLYAPSEADDPAFRAAVAALTGGTVDYFNTAVATPTAAQLSGYDCVFTWTNFPYSDRVLFGDRLADFVDAGGKVILGVFCTYTAGNSLGGRIMTGPYSPVTSPSGSNHFAVSAYVGDGTTSLHAGVLAYDGSYRDFLAIQGGGIVDGHYADGEIAQAYRPDGRVIYSNGTGAAPLAGTGDWPQIISNACMGRPTAHAMLYAPADADDPAYRVNIASFTGGPVNYFNSAAGTPSAALLATYDCAYTGPNSFFSDPTTWGDRLADFVDAGGKVILRTACTYDGFALGGRIMTPGYCPVASPTSANHFSVSAYAGDGATCLHGGVAAYATFFRDFLVAQGPGIVDGHYADGEIAHAYRPDGRVVYSNGAGDAALGGTGDWARLTANACECNLGSGHRILVAPSDPDDPAYRAAIAAQTGGGVDYFDAAAATPTVAFLSGYDCVYTWADFAYADPVLFGNRLATYVNGGGKVILGAFCTFTAGNSLGGTIMTPGYSPVASPTGANHFAVSAYIGDGTSCFHHGVLAYDCPFRDVLVPQGGGIVEARYADGEIAHAYRPDRRVIYTNGLGPPLLGTGDWPRLIANACDCGQPDGNAFACNNAGQLFVVNTSTGAGAFAANLPTGGAGSTEIEIDPVTGRAWLQARDGFSFDQEFSIGSGLAIGGPVPNGASYNGLEFALGRLYGTAATGFCGASELRNLDPTTGVGLPIGMTGLGPIAGLAFDERASALYGITSGCSGPSNLVRLDVTNGAATVLGPTGFRAGSLEFGPGGDLFAGGDATDGGNLYRVNPLTGVSRLIGPSGFGSITGIAFAPLGTVAVEDSPRAGIPLASGPNPGRGNGIRISFTMPVQGDAALSLFDIAGRLVWRHEMSALTPGEYHVAWDGRSSSGRIAKTGVYLVRFSCPTGTRTVRQIMVK